VEDLVAAAEPSGNNHRKHFPRGGVEPDFDHVEGSFEKFVRSKGLKLTSQRRRILKKVFSNHRHFTADEVHDMFKRTRDRISRATVYRTLALLVEGGFLDVLDLGGDRKYYEHILGHEHHDHIVCLSCERIVEFQEPLIEKLQEEVARRLGFRISSHSLRLFGYCAECLSRLPDEKKS
jgi:Fur family ferric uptake transcriptional regulator